MAAIDIVNRVFREFKRYTGDGLPGEPTGAPLPVGDPSSGVHTPKNSELRSALLAPLGEAQADADRAEDAADLAEAARVAAETAAAGVMYPVSYEVQALTDPQKLQARKNTDTDIHTATAKSTLVDADEFGLWDSVSARLRKLSYANLKAGLLTYFGGFFPATPTLAAGAGQMLSITAGSGAGFALPAGGTWAYSGFSYSTSAGTLNGGLLTGVAAGGTLLAGGVSGQGWFGWAWRTSNVDNIMAHVFGDSIAAGMAASIPAKSFAGLLAPQFPVLAKHGVSTAMIVDQWDIVQAVTIDPGDTSIIFVGTNDQACYDTNVAKRGYFIDAQRATAVRLSAEWKPATPGNVSFVGTWTSVYAWGSYGSATPGNTASFVAEGTHVVLGMVRQKDNTGTYRVRIAGVDQGVFQMGGDVTTLLGRSYGPRALSFATSPGDLVEVSVVTADSSNVVMFQWLSSFAPKAKVVICNIPYAVNYTYGGSDANVDAYNTALATEVAALSSFGLDVSLADVRSVLTDADMYDNVHPNDSGHQKIRDRIVAVL